MRETFSDSWTAFLEEVRTASETLVANAGSCASDMEALMRDVELRFGPAADWNLGAPTTDSLRTLYENHAPMLLVEIVDQYRQSHIDEKLPRAFTDFRHRLDDAARQLPVKAEISPRAMIDALEDSAGMSWWAEFVRVRDRERLTLVRAAAAGALGTAAFRHRFVEGGFNLLLAQFALALLDPWQMIHSYALQQLRGEGEKDAAARFERSRKTWKDHAERKRRRGDELLGALRTALSELPGRLTQAVIRGPQSSGRKRQIERQQECESYWSRQRVAIRRLVDVETSLVALGKRSISLAEEVIDPIDREHRSIVEELDSAVKGLQSWSAGQPDPLPAASAQLTSTVDRTREWRGTIERHIRYILPERIESVEPVRPVPGFRRPWRPLEPRQTFLAAIRSAAGTAEEGFTAVEHTHRKLLREIDRAREVVAYSLQATEKRSGEGKQIAVEGVANALTLLSHLQELAEDPAPAAEAAVVRATASSFYQFLVAFEQGRFSLASHLAREGARRTSRRAAVLLADEGRRASRRAWSFLRQGYTWSLVRIGWLAPSDQGRQAVETRSYFGDRRAADSLPDLPLIYDRLFRPEPVEDRRFLIGREEEIAALEEARDSWKSGQIASIVLDGERGSGKTSLLNCAVAGPFAGEAVVRVSIRERLLSPDAVHAFLALALHVGCDKVVSSLHKERRIIVIEEVERTFLRVVDGLDALRELLSLIADTSRSNLWVLSLTSEGFRFLDAALGLGHCFSHRLHASAVTPRELQDAILQRHNLSGLRLEFAPPPRTGRLQEWLRQQTARVETPQEAFFRGLHSLSGGVFRSAFSIWRHHIERVDGGILYMRHLDTPDHSRLSQALSGEDLFSLQMLLQHGSLTPEEDARIFGCPVSVSQARIEHLIGRGILEPEPVAPGFRIQPEAGILVRAALNARNLI